MPNDPRQVGSFSVTVRTVVAVPGEADPRVSSDHRIEYTPATWRIAADELAARVRAADRCLVTLQQIPTGRRQSREHVILQGLGTRWVDLAPGLVDDGLNNSMSGSELRFLRSGLMGAFRSWYLGEKSEKTFERVGGGTIVYRHDPASGYMIQVRGGEFAPEVTPSGSGSFTFEVLDEPSDPVAVSRTLHKIAYLALAVRAPDLALSPLLDEARAFITDPSTRPFRSYAERFLPGAAPGFDLAFQVEGAVAEDGYVDPDRLLVGLRLHHVHYAFAASGRPPDPPPDGDDFIVHASGAPTSGGRRSMTWQFGRLESR